MWLFNLFDDIKLNKNDGGYTNYYQNHHYHLFDLIIFGNSVYFISGKKEKYYLYTKYNIYSDVPRYFSTDFDKHSKNDTCHG